MLNKALAMRFSSRMVPNLLRAYKKITEQKKISDKIILRSRLLKLSSKIKIFSRQKTIMISKKLFLKLSAIKLKKAKLWVLKNNNK